MRNFYYMLIAVSFSSCITLKAPVVKNVSNLQSSGLLSGTPRLSFDMLLYNPNTVSIALTDLNIYVNYGSLSLASIQLDTLQEVAAQSNFTIPFSISPSQVQINNFLQSGIGILNQGSGAKLNGKGSLRVQKFIFGKTFNFSF